MSEDKIITDLTHRQRALNLVKSCEGAPTLAIEQPALYVQVAQMHATLELAEQQRIANMIALIGFQDELFPEDADVIPDGVLYRKIAELLELRVE